MTIWLCEEHHKNVCYEGAEHGCPICDQIMGLDMAIETLKARLKPANTPTRRHPGQCVFCNGTGEREMDVGDSNDVVLRCDDCGGTGIDKEPETLPEDTPAAE